MDEILLQTKKLVKYFNTSRGLLHAVDNVDLKIPKGKTLGVVGESGCGKSTLGRVILRLDEPTSGEILFKGEDVTAFKGERLEQFRRQASIVFQDPYASLNPRMSTSQIIEDPLIVNKLYNSAAERRDAVFKIMDLVGLAPRLVNSYPHELDGGRRQRIGIARSLILNPEFIVCDEPVSALDVSIQAQILNLLMDLQDNLGLTYMFITHDLSVVKHISDEIMVMYMGVCVEKAKSKDLFRNPLHPYTKALIAAVPVPKLREKGVKRTILKGEVSSPINLPPGCRFAPRCPYACDKCRSDENLSLRDVGDGHLLSCAVVAQNT